MARAVVAIALLSAALASTSTYGLVTAFAPGAPVVETKTPAASAQLAVSGTDIRATAAAR